MTPEQTAQQISDEFFRGRENGHLGPALTAAIAAAIRSAREAGLREAIHAVMSPPAELYPDKATEEQIVDAAKKMGAVGAAGYFNERALHMAMEWHVKAIEALLTHPPAAQEAKEAAWQPIETAPKDGRRVDLWFPSSGRAADWQWETGGIIGRSGGMWVKRYPEGVDYEIAFEMRPNDHPTYWMIVSPPHAAADKAEGGGA